MMKNKFALLLLFILFCSCKTINQNRSTLNIPVSIVYFSFDDGPNANGDTTARLLDVLKKYQVKAMFCLLGENAEQHPELVKRMYDEGHYIANHGYSEKWASGMKPDQFRDNLVRGGEAISAAIGKDMHPKLYRPHGGFYTVVQEKIIRKEGYKLLPSTIRVYDAVVDGTKQSKVVNQVISKVEKQGGGFILLHDARDSYAQTSAQLAKNPNGVFNRSWIPETVDKIIPILLDKGYILNNTDLWTEIGY
jgi:peptidoglycan/xylan/chitin deacetylase (PgdA/CDA1 family)